MSLDYLWLVPVVYALHITEEAPRFVAWTKRYTWLFTSLFDSPRFWLGNALFMAYVLVSVYFATSHPSRWTITFGLSTAAWIFSNFLVHAVTTLTSGVYSPGVVTAGALYVPTTLYVYQQAWRAGALTPSIAAWSVVIGFAVMYVPFLNAIRVARRTG